MQQIELKSRPPLYQVFRLLYPAFVYLVKLFLLLLFLSCKVWNFSRPFWRTLRVNIYLISGWTQSATKKA